MYAFSLPPRVGGFCIREGINKVTGSEKLICEKEEIERELGRCVCELACWRAVLTFRKWSVMPLDDLRRVVAFSFSNYFQRWCVENMDRGVLLQVLLAKQGKAWNHIEVHRPDVTLSDLQATIRQLQKRAGELQLLLDYKMSVSMLKSYSVEFQPHFNSRPDCVSKKREREEETE